MGLRQLGSEREQDSLHQVFEMVHHIIGNNVANNSGEIDGRHFENLDQDNYFHLKDKIY
jgi:hypothetical protein